MNEIETNEQRFQRFGLDRMRLLVVTGGLPQHILTEAISWVAQRDEEERLRDEASLASQIRTALSAKYAAQIAAIAAIITLMWEIVSKILI